MAALIRLPDARRLAYAELGDPAGTPIIHHHGMPGSRLDHEGDFALYSQAGVRVITPDRPGYGMSDPLPRGTLLDWPRDVAALADALGLERFGITGLSGGGIFALACAFAMPERVSGVVVTGCPAPMDRPWAKERMRLMNRMGIWLALRAPWLLGAGTRLLAGVVRTYPEFFIREATRTNPPVDRRWLAETVVKGSEEESMREAFRQGGAGYVHDLRLLSRAWRFAPGDIRVPVQLWCGDQDNVIPPTHGMYLASVIAGSSLVMCPREGHMLMWNHLQEILDAASGRSRVAA